MNAIKRFDLLNFTILFQFLFMFFFAMYYRNYSGVMSLYTIINFSITVATIYITKKDINTKSILFLFLLLFLGFFHLIFFEYSIWIEILVLSNFVLLYYYFKLVIENGYLFQILNMLKIIIILFLIFALYEGLVKDNKFLTLLGTESLANEIVRTKNTNNYLIRGTMENPLIVSFFCIFITPFIFLFKNRFLRTTLLILSVFASFVTYKRTSMVLVISLVTIGYISKIIIADKKKFPASKAFKILLIVMLIISFLYFVPIYGETLFERIYFQFSKLENYNKYSIIHRSSSIRLGLEHFFNGNLMGLLLGNGYRSLSNYFSSNAITISVDGFYVIDNSYLTLLNDFGFIGILTFLIIVFKSLNLGIKRFINSENSDTKYFYFMCILSMFFCLVQIFFFDFMNWYQPIFCFALLIALLNSDIIYDRSFSYAKSKYYNSSL